ncbi:MAG TPA: hypothetical protein VIP05_31200 [Burkholderiaceae bacterium]
MSQANLFEVAQPSHTQRVAAARLVGERAASRCADKAARVASFDMDAACAWVIAHLDRHGPTSGEDLVDGMKLAKIQGHDDRCFGPVFQKLLREKRIERYGWTERRKGHGTAGGNIWRIVR